MAQLVLLILAVIAGFVGYIETAKYERRFGEGPWGVSAPMWGLVCGIGGFLAALLAAPLVLGVVAGFAGYNGATYYERQRGERLLRVAPVVWGAVCGASGLLGALVVSMIAWLTALGFLGLGAALVLVIIERNALVARTGAVDGQGSVDQRATRKHQSNDGTIAFPARPQAPSSGLPLQSSVGPRSKPLSTSGPSPTDPPRRRLASDDDFWSRRR
jgi:hypothetical protein